MEETGEVRATKTIPRRETDESAEERGSQQENCMDEDYVYHVVLQRDLTWKVTVYEKRGGLSEKEVREIDLASFVSEETLKRYPEFVRPESPRVRAAVKKMRQDAQS